ncbi:hypothetical protein [Rickettsia endosymbiont of Rhinocyllus conicus]|uniref:tetratricopeptide repeat protein n=1 Tax=Rickettsia endosymbiont of Rhinocyllus conicus TaxID=3066252 RepID=UPI003132B187
MINHPKHPKHPRYIREKQISSTNSSSQESITSNKNETQTKQVEESTKTVVKLGIEKEIENIFESENFINLVNKYSDESIFSKNKKVLIILGQEQQDLNIIVNFFKDNKLSLERNTHKDWYFSKKNPVDNPEILDSFRGYVTYKSPYLNSEASTQELTLDKFLLPKILSTAPTKFILAVKNIDTTKNAEEGIKNIAQIFKKFTQLLGNVDINEGNVAIVVTDSKPSDDKERISNIFHDAIELCNFNDKQKSFINKIQDSIYLLPQASEQAKDYKALPSFKSGNYITQNENNKITIDEKLIPYFIIQTVKNNITNEVSKFKELVYAKWEKEKSLVFKFKVSNNTDKLQKLVETIKNYKATDNSNKTIGSFLEVVKELNQILETPNSKLESFLNYLKHFSDTKLSDQHDLDIIDVKDWFSTLFASFNKIDLEAELIESFKTVLKSDEFSFVGKLNDAIKDFYQDIKNSKILDINQINNIENLKAFLKSIKDAKIQNLKDITDTLTNNIHCISFKSLDMSKIILDSISNFKKLVSSISEQQAKSLWTCITAFKSIDEKSFTEVIYSKLLHSQIAPMQEQSAYNSLGELLIATHGSIAFHNKQDELYKNQLAEIYCQHAQVVSIPSAIDLYKKAAALDSVKANTKLGNIYLQQREYAKALEYLRKTKCIDDEEKAFNGLIDDMMHNSQINNRNLADEYLLQAGYYKKHSRIDDATKAYLIAIGKMEGIVEPKDYLKLSDIYRNLANTVLPNNNNKTEYFMQATGYKELAEKFDIPQNIEQDTSVDFSRPIYDPKDVLLSGDDSDYYSDSGN